MKVKNISNVFWIKESKIFDLALTVNESEYFFFLTVKYTLYFFVIKTKTLKIDKGSFEITIEFLKTKKEKER